MKIKSHVSRLLPTKQGSLIILATLLLITGIFSGCGRKAEQENDESEKVSSTSGNDTTTTEKNTESLGNFSKKGSDEESSSKKSSDKKDASKVISPNTIHDQDEDASGSDTNKNSKSEVSSESKESESKPVVDPATEPELEPEVSELTNELAEEMIPLFDSMALAVSSSDDTTSDEYVWHSLYLAMVNYASEGENGVFYSDDYFYEFVPASIVQDYGNVMFAGMTKLPAIPEGLSSQIIYLPESDYYQFASSDRGAGVSVVTGITPEGNGTYLVDTSLRTYETENTYTEYATFTFRVEPNSSSDSNTVSSFPYVIRELVKVTRV